MIDNFIFFFFFRCHLGRGRLEILRHTSRFSTSLVHSARLCPVQDLMSSVHFLSERPHCRLPSTPPSSISLHMVECLLICPKYFNFRDFIVLSISWLMFIRLHTSLFVFLSFQLILPILLIVNISKALIVLSNSLFKVHVSEPYSSTERT